MGFGGGPEPVMGWFGVVNTSRRSSMSNFAAMFCVARLRLSPDLGATSRIVNQFRNTMYGFMYIYVISWIVFYRNVLRAA
jgi:hypothetical protein